MMAATAATAAAAKKSAKFQKMIKAQEAALAKQGKAAKAATKKRIAVYKAKMAKADAMKKHQMKVGAHIVKLQAKLKVAHAKVLSHIQKAYNKHSAKLAASLKKSEAGFAVEKAKISMKFRKAMKGNAAAYKLKKAALAAELKASKAAHAAALKVIAKKDKAAKAALAKANKKEAGVKAAKAAVEKARRAGERKVKAGKAAEADKKYKTQMAEAGRKKAAAKAAEAAAEASNKKSVEEQKTADALAAAHQKKDAAMVECATDGSECQSGNKCKKINNKKGPYMAKDGFSCSSSKQAWVGDVDESGGLAWAGIDQEAAPLAPLVAADPKKCAALTAGAKGLFKAAISNKKSCPLLTSACAGKPVTFAARKAAMMSVFDWAAACKPFCYPGTETKTADGVVDSHGICLDADDIMQAKQQITSMPSYKASGTGGRFPAGPDGDICKMAKELVCGAATGAGEPLCK